MQQIQISVEENGYSAYDYSGNPRKTYVFACVFSLCAWIRKNLNLPEAHKPIDANVGEVIGRPGRILPSNEGVATDSNPYGSIPVKVSEQPSKIYTGKPPYTNVWSNEFSRYQKTPPPFLAWDEGKRVICKGRSTSASTGESCGNPDCNIEVRLSYIPKNLRMLSDL